MAGLHVPVTVRVDISVAWRGIIHEFQGQEVSGERNEDGERCKGRMNYKC